jgi:hypothetical protein
LRLMISIVQAINSRQGLPCLVCSRMATKLLWLMVGNF